MPSVAAQLSRLAPADLGCLERAATLLEALRDAPPRPRSRAAD
jgi:hypothetical protein